MSVSNVIKLRCCAKKCQKNYPKWRPSHLPPFIWGGRFESRNILAAIYFRVFSQLLAIAAGQKEIPINWNSNSLGPQLFATSFKQGRNRDYQNSLSDHFSITYPPFLVDAFSRYFQSIHPAAGATLAITILARKIHFDGRLCSDKWCIHYMLTQRIQFAKKWAIWRAWNNSWRWFRPRKKSKWRMERKWTSAVLHLQFVFQMYFSRNQK